jgi:predicted nucleic acid-binding protein
MLVFLDACIIIYWVESAEPFYSQLLAQLAEIAHHYPQHQLTISRLSLMECLVKPLRDTNKELIVHYQYFFEIPQIRIVEIDHQVIDRATFLRAKYNLRTPDAIQAASCLSLNNPHIFLTNDSQFNQLKELNVRRANPQTS